MISIFGITIVLTLLIIKEGEGVANIDILLKYTVKQLYSK